MIAAAFTSRIRIHFSDNSMPIQFEYLIFTPQSTVLQGLEHSVFSNKQVFSHIISSGF